MTIWCHDIHNNDIQLNYTRHTDTYRREPLPKGKYKYTWHLLKIGCFAKKKNIVSLWKAVEINKEVYRTDRSSSVSIPCIADDISVISGI
jgi:hypothetical protein